MDDLQGRVIIIIIIQGSKLTNDPDDKTKMNAFDLYKNYDGTEVHPPRGVCNPSTA